MDGRERDGRPHFIRLGARQGLASENIDKLLEDARGQIWASTDDGLAVIDPNTFAIRSLRRAEGVAHRQSLGRGGRKLPRKGSCSLVPLAG